MASPHGVAGQFGYASETNPGQAVTVDKFLPINSESVTQEIERIESQGIRAGRLTTHTWKPGQHTIAGTIELELWNTDVAAMLTHMFGDVATATNSGQWNYTYTPGGLTGKSFTAQVGRPDIGGTVRPFTWAGCKVGEWTISADVGEIATLSLDIVAMTETNGTGLASASYDTTLNPFVFTEASLSIGGATNNTVQSVELSGSNGLTERFRLGQATSREYLENALREYTGTLTTDFEDLTAYNRFVNGTTAALVLQFDNGTETLVFTLNARFDGDSPQLGGVELLEQSLPFKAVSTTSDAAAITAVLTNAEGFGAAA